MSPQRGMSLDYETKEAGYFAYPRVEMVSLVPASCRRLLDVGCGNGAFAALVKEQRQIEVWGVEPFPAAAEKAAEKLDRVIVGAFEGEKNLPGGFFDCIVFSDVLEHLVNPELALRSAKSLLAPGGIVLASIPNVRYFPVVWMLAVHGEWKYQEHGILDETHLRFFTRLSMLRLFQGEGYNVKSIQGINPYVSQPNVRGRLWRAYRVVNALTFGLLNDLKFLQFAVIAEPSIADQT